MYTYEVHLHTAEVSACGQVPAADAVRLYKDLGYSGMVVTDHYYEGFFEKHLSGSWDDAVDRYLRGYRIAFRAGERLGVAVLLGMELRFADHPNDYLVYGVTERFLYEHPRLYEMRLSAFRQLASEEGLFISQAHPFRDGMTPADPAHLDGIEVYNMNPRHNSRNDRARAYASMHGLTMLAGSDFHQPGDEGRAGVFFDERVFTEEAFVGMLPRIEESDLLYSRLDAVY